MEEAERAIRLGRILATADAVLGSRANAWAWLREPNLALDRARPVDLLKSEIGARVVEETLVRLEHGLFA
jgi:putative toxin-antitoxin system antitoxin component (TIGR02293 family)